MRKQGMHIVTAVMVIEVARGLTSVPAAEAAGFSSLKNPAAMFFGNAVIESKQKEIASQVQISSAQALANHLDEVSARLAAAGNAVSKKEILDNQAQALAAKASIRIAQAVLEQAQLEGVIGALQLRASQDEVIDPNQLAQEYKSLWNAHLKELLATQEQLKPQLDFAHFALDRTSELATTGAASQVELDSARGRVFELNQALGRVQAQMSQINQSLSQ